MVENIPIYLVTFNNEKKLNIMVERFKSIDIDLKIIPPVNLDDDRIKKSKRDIRETHITLQHLSKMYDFYHNTNYKYCIVCEDDVLPRKTFKQDLPKIVEDFEKMNLDILLLGYLLNHDIVNSKYKLVDGMYSYHRYDQSIFGTQMYMVSRNYVKYLLDKYNGNYSEINGDKIYAADYTITQEGNRAILNPMLAIEEISYGYKDRGQLNFHKSCFLHNYNENYVNIGLDYEESIESKINFIINDRSKGCSEKGVKSCKELLEKKLTIQQLFELLYNYQIISWRVEGKEKSKEICLKFIENLNNEEFYKLYLNRKNNIDNNFKFCDITI